MAKNDVFRKPVIEFYFDENLNEVKEVNKAKYGLSIDEDGIAYFEGYGKSLKIDVKNMPEFKEAKRRGFALKSYLYNLKDVLMGDIKEARERVGKDKMMYAVWSDVSKLTNKLPKEDPFKDFPEKGDKWNNLENYFGIIPIHLIGFTEDASGNKTLFFELYGRLYSLSDYSNKPIQRNWNFIGEEVKKTDRNIAIEP